MFIISKALNNCICYCFIHFRVFKHFIKVWFLHHNYLCIIWLTPNIFVLIFEIFYCLLDFEFERESVSNYREISNYKRGDVASLAKDHCSLITRASQFSSTTRNLVPRFKRGARGNALVTII